MLTRSHSRRSLSQTVSSHPDASTLPLQTQAMVPFLRRFGELGANGKYALPADFLSYSNAFPFTVQFCGRSALPYTLTGSPSRRADSDTGSTRLTGIIFGSFISERYGRRMTIFVMSIWALCCVPIILTSQGRSQFLAARCLNSLYIVSVYSHLLLETADLMSSTFDNVLHAFDSQGMEMSTIPVFQGELGKCTVRTDLYPMSCQTFS
jgi:hypothetical protein